MPKSCLKNMLQEDKDGMEEHKEDKFMVLITTR